MQIPKGLFDIIPYKLDETWRFTDLWHYIESVIHKIAHDYSFKEIRTPIFEKTELFQRGVGETSDIVSKEMYTFFDKAKRSMTLRPEGTASIMRAFIEKNLASFGPKHKFYYIGPMFRYERPQSGRYRQHHQFGVEAIGDSSYTQDAEVIDILYQFFQRLGLKNLSISLNFIGSASSRDAYKSALLNFLKPQFEKLSKDSQTRFHKNPLRILDSKDLNDQKIIKNAPMITKFLSKEESSHFDHLCELLKELKIPYKINPKLVRGLDYYDKTVFEVISEELGAQTALGGGGRYDSLLANIGGPDLPGIGFAIGLERVIQTMLKQNIAFPSISNPFVYFIALGEEVQKYTFTLLTQFRHMKIPSEMDFHIKKIQKSLQMANKLQASICIIIGSDEIASKKVKIKHMQTREEESVDLEKLPEYVLKLYKEYQSQQKEIL